MTRPDWVERMTEDEAKDKVVKDIASYNRVRARAEEAELGLIEARAAFYHLRRAFMTHNERMAEDAERQRKIDEADR